MIIEEKRTTKPLAELEVGECFEFDDGFFVKTDETTANDLRICADIQYGTLERLDEEYMVMPVNAKVVIE